ncbi:MAG TPA: glycosyltransferase, partial [Thermoanaerobaculia bacterium]|nr:glycosyltransferase [Thermoanaerobaculia bacterium]
YADTHGYPPERIETIPIGTPVPERVDREVARRRLAAVLGLPPEAVAAPIVLHAGSFTPEKDHAGLLRAFAQVAPRHPHARLVLAGDGPLREEIEAAVRRLGLAGRVHLPGARADLGDWMGGGDLLVLSSRVEGVPGVVLEAAARELPVVATGVGAVAEAVLDGETGLLVAPGDPRALAEALDRLLGDAPLRERLGRAGRERVRRHFALPAVVDRFEELYRRLAGGGLG